MIKILAQLESCGIVHRDLKAENLLVNEVTDEIKLIDFGFSKLFEDGQLMRTACGSPHYCAPEILAKEDYDPVKADIWSAGVLLYYMLCGYLPFFEENLSDLYSKIIFGELQVPSHINSEASSLLFSILNTSPQKRPSLEAILHHPWLNMRKLYSTKDLYEIDWDTETNLSRSEAMGALLQMLFVGPHYLGR